MKNILLVIVAMLNLTAFSQGLNGEISINDDFNQYSQGNVVSDEFSYFIKQQLPNDLGITTCSLYKADTLGNALWNNLILPPLSAAYMDVSQMIPSADGGVYIIANCFKYCDIRGDCFWFLREYSANGTILWTTAWSDPSCIWFGNAELGLTGLSLDETNNLIVNVNYPSSSKIFTFGSGGTLIDSLEINRPALEGINNLTNYEKIAFKQDTLFGFDINGDVSSAIGFNSSIRDAKVLNDTLYVLILDSIFTFNTALQVLAGTDVNGYSEYTNLKVDNKKIEFISHSLNDQFIITLDHQLAVANILTIPIALGIGTPKDFNDSHFSTSINFPLTTFTSIRHLDYSRHSNQNVTVNRTDIGIVAIQPTQTSATINNPIPSVLYDYEIYADVMIKNFGNNTLNECRINHRIQQRVDCGYSYYTEQFSNLNLAPNDSMWLTLGLIHFGMNVFTAGDSVTFDLCVYTSHPNFTTDLNMPNDEYCLDVFFGYSDINDPIESDINLYPNPANSFITFELNNSENLSRYSVFSTLGTQIKQGEISSNKIDISSLPVGVYILHLSSDDRLIAHKQRFVKE